MKRSLWKSFASSTALAWGTLAGCATGSPPADDLASVQEGLERTLAADIPPGSLPGYSIALVDEHGVLWSGGYGFANLREERRVTADTSFWLASISKTLVGTAIVSAEEHGKLPLDSNVSGLVAARAGFQIATPDSAPITLEQLVTHTSSIRDSLFYLCSYYVGEERGSRASLLETSGKILDPEGELSGLGCDDHSPADLGGFMQNYLSAEGIYYTPDNFAKTDPSAAPVYSNVGAALAGYAFELATGTSLADYADDRIFRPLGMKNTSWRLSKLRRSNVALPYAWDAQKQQHAELPLYSLSTWPDGGVRSSANDLGTFLAMVIHQGELHGRRVLRQQSVQRMLTPIVGDTDDGTGVFWSLGRPFWGAGKPEDGAPLIGHSGGDPGATTLMYFDPDKRVGFVFLANSDPEHAADTVDVAFIDHLLAEAERLHARRGPRAELAASPEAY